MKKYKLGYVTGVFDMLHIGHINFLRSAREQCQRLIVGVCTDELVREYMNETPVVSFEERLQIVAAVKYVDLAIPQETVEKPDLSELQDLDVVFHGDNEKNALLHRAVEQPLQEEGHPLVLLSPISTTDSPLLKHYLEKKQWKKY